jgi:hypothetical protein
LLEENSFAFVERHELRPGKAIPGGYRSPWTTRHQLAMAKCAGSIDETTSDRSHRSLLLRPAKHRAADEFIEVFIFGPFNRGAVERIVVPTNPTRDASANELGTLKSKARLRSIPVEEA